MALPGSIEIGFARFGIARQDIQNLVTAAVGRRGDLTVQERGDIRHLLAGQVELRHPFLWTTGFQVFADLFSFFVVHHQHRADQVRPARPALRVRAVADTAGRDELFPAAVDGGLIELRSSSPKAVLGAASDRGRRLLLRAENQCGPQQEHGDRTSMLCDTHLSSRTS